MGKRGSGLGVGGKVLVAEAEPSFETAAETPGSLPSGKGLIGQWHAASHTGSGLTDTVWGQPDLTRIYTVGSGCPTSVP